MNKSQIDQQYTIDVIGLDSANVNWSKSNEKGFSRTVNAGEIGDFTAIVSLPPAATYKRSQTITLSVKEQVGLSRMNVLEETRFWGPAD